MEIILCSIYINSFSEQSEGFETYRYPGTSGTMAELQKNVHEEVMKVLKTYEIANRGMKQKNLAVVRETNMPALLTET
jgi:N-acetylmuramoyl-L-alanine amidase